MAPCTHHRLLVHSGKGQPHWIFLLSPAIRTAAKGPQAPRQSNVGFHTCTNLCLKKKTCAYLRLLFTRYFVIKQVLCALKRGIQTLLVGKAIPGYKFVLDSFLFLRQKNLFSSPKSSYGMRKEIIFSATNYFCESRKCCHHHHAKRALKYLPSWSFFPYGPQRSFKGSA